MTVLHAYQMLESQGIVSSQERSGFLVTAKASNASKERVQATEAVSINDFVYEVLQASRDPHMFSLGFAYPDPSLYPRQHLNKSIAAAAQQISLTSAMDNLPPGNLDLRKIIAKRYAAKGVNISPDEIIITAGALEAARGAELEFAGMHHTRRLGGCRVAGVLWNASGASTFRSKSDYCNGITQHWIGCSCT